MLAALLNWPQTTFISKLDLVGQTLHVTREVDQGLEVVQTELPAVISVDLRLNEPRYATLPNIMKAKQKPLQIIDITSLDLNLNTHLKTIQIKNPSSRPNGIIVESVSALLDKLQHEAKVIV